MLRTVVCGLCWLALTVSVTPVAAATPVLRNDEFGLRVVFPEAARVCPALSGDHEHGFYAWYGGQKTNCSSGAGDVIPTAISVQAYYNVLPYKSAWEQLAPECRTARPGRVIGEARWRKLAFRSHDSVRCVTVGADGQITIDVATLAWKWPGNDPDFTEPYVVYFANLTTRRETLDRDMALFIEVMDSVVLSKPR